MIRLLGSVHQCAAIAVSGGVDSMAALSFLHKANPNIVVVHFNHGTDHGAEAEKFVRDYAQSQNILIFCGRITRAKESHESWEEYWRIQRFAYFNSLGLTIATAHHLNDAVETYLFGVCHNTPFEKKIGYRHGNVIRPFLLTPKAELESWAVRHTLPFLQDPSNQDLSHPRNRIRHEIVPQILQVNPGFVKSFEKKLRSRYEKDL